MDATRSASRIIGLLILGQIVSGGLVNFVLLAPLFGAPGFLVTAAPHATQIAVAALLGVAAGALTVAIAIAAFPIFKQYSHAMALWFFGLAVASFSVSAVENINVMSMLSLSEEYAKASVADRDQLFQTLRVVVASPRNWALKRSVIGNVFMTARSTLRSARSRICVYRCATLPSVKSDDGAANEPALIQALGLPVVEGVLTQSASCGPGKP